MPPPAAHGLRGNNRGDTMYGFDIAGAILLFLLIAPMLFSKQHSEY